MTATSPPGTSAAAARAWSGVNPVSSAPVASSVASTWGLVYGIARLDIHGKIPQTVPADPVALVHSGIDAIYRGWQE